MTLGELDKLVQDWKNAYLLSATVCVLKGNDLGKATGLDASSWAFEDHEGDSYLYIRAIGNE